MAYRQMFHLDKSEIKLALVARQELHLAKEAATRKEKQSPIDQLKTLPEVGH